MPNNNKLLDEAYLQVDNATYSPNSVDGISTNKNNSNNNAFAIDSAYGGFKSSNSNNNNSNYINNANNTEFDDVMANMIDNRNYRELFDNVTQLANVRQLSQKYLQNNLRQAGLYGTGEGTTMSTRLNNAYLNAGANALNNYYNNEYTDEQTKTSEWQSMLQVASQNGNVESTLQAIFDSNPNMSDETRLQLQNWANAYNNSNTENSAKASTYMTNIQNALNNGASYDQVKNLVDSWFNEGGALYGTDENTRQTIYDYLESMNAVNTATGIGAWLQNNGYNTNGATLDISDVNSGLYNYIDETGNKIGSKFRSQITNMGEFVNSNNINKPTMFALSNGNGLINVIYDPSTRSYYPVSRETARAFRQQYSGSTYYVQNGYPSSGWDWWFDYLDQFLK